ncbi:hypothetical protein Thimo_2575 [Thioflavicoccus mobilis 8321]|uniref:Uncharacterized protein n=1 Tax=Thioflavicoccus mobilis 8321 TaxID=765912 RepID=L0H137_9GAMM|nr:hypothetical protein Thimo_2575 [Thioflavicoccus mobilis 8321]
MASAILSLKANMVHVFMFVDALCINPFNTEFNGVSDGADYVTPSTAAASHRRLTARLTVMRLTPKCSAIACML